MPTVSTQWVGFAIGSCLPLFYFNRLRPVINLFQHKAETRTLWKGKLYATQMLPNWKIKIQNSNLASQSNPLAPLQGLHHTHFATEVLVSYKRWFRNSESQTVSLSKAPSVAVSEASKVRFWCAKQQIDSSAALDAARKHVKTSKAMQCCYSYKLIILPALHLLITGQSSFSGNKSWHVCASVTN